MKKQRTLTRFPVTKTCCDSGIHYLASRNSRRFSVGVVSILEWSCGIALTVDDLPDAPLETSTPVDGMAPNISFNRTLHDVEAVQAKEWSSLPIPKSV